MTTTTRPRDLTDARTTNCLMLDAAVMAVQSFVPKNHVDGRDQAAMCRLLDLASAQVAEHALSQATGEELARWALRWALERAEP